MNERVTLRTLARAAALLCVSALVALSTVPGSERPHVFDSGNAEHFIAYAGTTFFLAVGYARRFVWAWGALLSGTSAVLEVAQIWIPGRSAGIDNWAASTAGAFAGAMLAVFCVQLITRRVG